MIPRLIEHVVRVDAQSYPVVAVLGARQAGKTTLVRSVFPDHTYVNLEDPETRSFAGDDPRGFLADGTVSMVIDEFQRVPTLLSYIQTIVDKNGIPGQYVLTGSQNVLMSEKISQSLAGRVALFTLPPLSLEELRKVDMVEEHRELQMRKGFFPRLYNHPMDVGRYYRNYIQTYIERDVRNIKNVADLSVFQDFVRLLAGRVGQVLNLSSLGNDAGVSHNTVKAWIGILEAGYIVHQLRPYHRNFNKQTMKSPKVYFTDSGVLCALLGIDSDEALRSHHLTGGIFENFVIGELRKAQLNRGLPPRAHFWRDRRGNEVDLLLDDAETRTAIEIKSGRTIASDFFSGLNYYGALDPSCPTGRRFIVYGGREQQMRSNGRVVGWQWLANPTTWAFPQ
ncbi:MAG: ATP-binding protein [Alkalispirochaeta sp.]